MPKRKQDKFKVVDLLHALDEFFLTPTFMTFRELPVDSREARDSVLSRIDYWAIKVFNAPDFHPLTETVSTTYSIEVKVDRRDFLQELKKPHKQFWALMYSNQFYFCAPKGLIKIEELPEYAGLLEYDNAEVQIAFKAPWRKGELPRWTFVVSLLHQAKSQLRRAPIVANRENNDAPVVER
ncbi:MAG: hypothetical protein HYY49_03360 [Ignavibacteriales bacterium]|nr:hypothetical protein [Ignavibacteriales bacterium]